MPYVAYNSRPGSPTQGVSRAPIAQRVITRAPAGPIMPRRRTVGYPLGVYSPEQWLRHYPDGAPLSSPTLGDYRHASWLQHYTNGRTLESAGGGAGMPKIQMVVLSFQQAMRKKAEDASGCTGCKAKGAACQGCAKHPASQATHRGTVAMQRSKGAGNYQRRSGGLGDDGGDASGADFEAGLDTSSSAPIDIPGQLGTDSGGQTYSVYPADYNPTAVTGSPMSTIAGAPSGSSPSTFTSSLSNLLNSLFRPTTYPYTTPVYSTLASPISAGSSISWGGILLVGGIVLLGAKAVGSRYTVKKR